MEKNTLKEHHRPQKSICEKQEFVKHEKEIIHNYRMNNGVIYKVVSKGELFVTLML